MIHGPVPSRYPPSPGRSQVRTQFGSSAILGVVANMHGHGCQELDPRQFSSHEIEILDPAERFRNKIASFGNALEPPSTHRGGGRRRDASVGSGAEIAAVAGTLSATMTVAETASKNALIASFGTCQVRNSAGTTIQLRGASRINCATKQSTGSAMGEAVPDLRQPADG